MKLNLLDRPTYEIPFDHGRTPVFLPTLPHAILALSREYRNGFLEAGLKPQLLSSTDEKSSDLESMSTVPYLWDTLAKIYIGPVKTMSL